MKKRFLNSIRNSIRKQYPNYTEDKLDEIMYGIEGLYLTITKTIVIFTIALILGIVKELIFLLITCQELFFVTFFKYYHRLKVKNY